MTQMMTLETPLDILSESPSHPETEENSFVTLEPFERSRRRQKRQRQNPTLSHFDSLFGKNDWSRYLVMKTHKKLTLPVLENHLLKKCPSTNITFRELNENGDKWLLEATTINQSENLLSLTEKNGVGVKVT